MLRTCEMMNVCDPQLISFGVVTKPQTANTGDSQGEQRALPLMECGHWPVSLWTLSGLGSSLGSSLGVPDEETEAWNKVAFA